MYDPITGRFLSRDPIMVAVPNYTEVRRHAVDLLLRFAIRKKLPIPHPLYAYTDGAPLIHSDPLGLDRYICGNGHVWIEVDVYGPGGRVIGRRYLDRRVPTGSGDSCWVSIFYRNYPENDMGYSNLGPCSRHRSTPEEDRRLLEFWESRMTNVSAPCNYLVWSPCFFTAPQYTHVGIRITPETEIAQCMKRCCGKSGCRGSSIRVCSRRCRSERNRRLAAGLVGASPSSREN